MTAADLEMPIKKAPKERGGELDRLGQKRQPERKRDTKQQSG